MPSAAVSPEPFWAAWNEPRPRDFSARLPRRPRAPAIATIGLQRRWTLGIAALAAVALPAFAAPDRFAIADAVAQDAPVEPMPFERAGGSFPGSAFYYLDAQAPVPQVGEGIRSDADGAMPGIVPAPSPAARPLRIDNSGVDRTRALQCLTAAIYYEAASEPDAGQRAVAQVVLNRVAHPAYPGTVCGVVYQGSERSTGCQFSFTCDGSLARRPSPMFWRRAEDVAREALAGYVYAPAGLATHYHTVQVNPYWAPSLHYLATIGLHRFYSFNGAAGRPGAFRYAYLGGEPVAAPHPRGAAGAMAPPAIDPLAVQRAFDSRDQAGAGAITRDASPVAVTTPIYSSELRERGGETLFEARNLPQTHGIKPEYVNSGRWIAQPGS